MKKIAFATAEKIKALSPDDRLVIPLLAENQIQVLPAVWSDDNVNWQAFDAVIIRSCWDYHLKPQQFRDWIDHVTAPGVPLWNPPELLNWNSDKRYLKSLAEKEIPIVPTAWQERAGVFDVKGVMQASGWQKAVVKPVVSASAHQTYSVALDDEENIFNDIAGDIRAGGLFMIQEFMDRVVEEGEWSLMFFGGQFSHAVLKTPKSGDFRVQEEFGGITTTPVPPPHILAGARAILAAVSSPILYARVDGIDTGEQFILMELELIEPFLFLEKSPSAPANFKDAIINLAMTTDT